MKNNLKEKQYFKTGQVFRFQDATLKAYSAAKNKCVDCYFDSIGYDCDIIACSMQDYKSHGLVFKKIK